MPGALRPKGESAARPRAILFTDIVGSTSYFARHGDEAGLRMLGRHNRALFPVVEEANGRIVKTIGDSILAVFDQPVDALQAAWGLQQRLAELLSTLTAEEEGIHIRVGVHYGLVTEKDNDVFGDAVNLAERVKSKAAGDQVFVSRTLREMVRARPGFVFQSAGLHELKGASEPMELFQLTGASAAPPVPRWRKWARRRARAVRRRARVIAAVALLLLAAGGIWWWVRPARFPERAVAVLPFVNTAHDSNTDYLSLALPDQLNTQLGSSQNLIVRPFPPVKRDQAGSVDLRGLARELQVGTIIKGNFWREGKQLRVTVDVVGTQQDRDLWSRPFEGTVENVLGLMNQMAPEVVEAVDKLMGKGRAAGPATAGNAPGASSAGAGSLAGALGPVGTKDPEAYDLYLRGRAAVLELTKENIQSAKELLEQAVAKDPNFAKANAALAQVYVTNFWWNFSNDPTWLDRAEALAERAVTLAPHSAEAHYALAYALEGKGQRAEAIHEYLMSVLANPHYLPALTNVARYFFYMGDFDRALGTLDRIAAIDPKQNIHVRKAIYLYFAGRLDASREENRKAEQQAMGVNELTFVTLTYVWLGDLGSAERVLRKLEQVQKDAPSIVEIRAWLDTARGNIPQARQEMKILEAKASHRWGIAQELASLYARQGDRAQALFWLEKAVQMGGPSYSWFSSKDFQLLRGDPRYEAALKTLSNEYQPLRPEFDQVYTEIRQ
jgi:class 3 adenylate cyclase/TolB-like protein/tetratricopeptide (TPR) repeat protein